MNLNVLMIDDHPPIIEGYKAMLVYNDLGYKFNTTIAYSCNEAYTILLEAKNNIVFDLIFVDLTVTPYPEKNLNSGEDLIILVKKQLPNSKIVVLTSYTEAFLLLKIINEANINGMLIKNDITPDEFIHACIEIIKGNLYFSKTVINKKLEKFNKTAILDNYNRQIITLLASGVQTKNLGKHLFLSNSAIEKRKAAIKLYFSIEKGTDEDIIREAKKADLI